VIPLKRKLMAARADLAEKMAAQARKRGSTLYAYTNEILEGVLGLEAERPFHEFVEFYRALELARTLGLVLAPPALWDGADDMEEEAEKLGVNAALYIKNREENPQRSVEAFLRALIWNASIFSLQLEEYTARLEVVGQNIPDEQMEFFLSAAGGALSVLGYHETSRSTNSGLGIVHYSRESRQNRREKQKTNR